MKEADLTDVWTDAWRAHMQLSIALTEIEHHQCENVTVSVKWY